jgi:tetratricopeptide (TPR) repeat protein
MGQVASAMTSGWGLAAGLFAALAVAGAVLQRGHARAFAVSASAVMVVLLLAVGITQSPQPAAGGAEQALAGPRRDMTRDVPRTDRDVAAALMTQAAREANLGDTAAARKTYERAQQMYRAEKDILGEAGVALGLGRLEHMTGQSARARQNYGAALALFQQGGSAIGQARVYASMGDLEKDTFQWAKASEYYALARAQWQRAPEPKSDPHVMLGIEDVPLLRGGEERARSALTQARKIYDQLGDQAGIADIGMILAHLELNLGRIDLARAQFADARALFNGAGDKNREADAGLQVAAIDIRRGYNRQAVEYLADARALFEGTGNAVGIGRAHIAYGDLERLQGRVDLARRHYGDAAAALAPTNSRIEAEALRKLGQLEMVAGNRDAARAALDKAIAVAVRTGAREEEGIARVVAAVVARDSGDAAAGNAHGAAANAIFDQVRNAEQRARAALATATEHDGFRDAAERMRSARMPVGVVQAQLGLGDALAANGNAADAAVAYRAAEQTWNALNNKLVEANRLLDLPLVDGLYIVAPPPRTDFYDAEPHPEDFEPDPVLVKANVDQFPHHNFEARRLVEQTEKRLNTALESLRGR